MLRIYVSSTYEDLKDERKAARDAIQTLGHLAIGMEDYAASDERPLERCLRDVRSCQAYVGIFAWRYGFCPGNGEKSITSLEYEEATKNKIPCYVFLVREDAPWPRTWIPDEDQPKIKQLRQSLSLKHMVGWFTNEIDLAAAITKSLTSRIVNSPGTPRIPDMLPYLCDRSEQEFALVDALKDADKRPGNPLLCIIHGNETEAHDKFLERLQKVTLPMLLSGRTQQKTVKLYRVEWPQSFRTDQEMSSRLEMSLSREVLDSHTAKQAEINDRLSQNLGPVVVHSHVITENWLYQGKKALNAYIQSWQEWPELSVGQMLFIFLFVKYQVNKQVGASTLRKFMTGNLEMRDMLKKYDFQAFTRLTGKVLPELQGATLGEAQDWARSEEAGKFCDPNALVMAIAAFYAEWERTEKSKVFPVRIPTDQLVPKLREIISLNQLSVEKIL